MGYGIMPDLGISTGRDKEKMKIQEREWLYDSSMSSNPIRSRKTEGHFAIVLLYTQAESAGDCNKRAQKDFIPQNNSGMKY